MNPRLYYPVKPVQVNQPFGANAAYYAKFHDSFGNPLKGHDGIDFFATHGQPVYAAHDGMIHYEKDSHGGEGMWIKAPGTYTVYWHLIGDTDPQYPSPIPLDGKEYPVKCGDLIGYADNTGAPYESSGTHLHFGLCLLDDNYMIMNRDNGFAGRVDPQPYFTGIASVDYPQVVQKESLLVTLLSKIIEILKGRA